MRRLTVDSGNGEDHQSGHHYYHQLQQQSQQHNHLPPNSKNRSSNNKHHHTLKSKTSDVIDQQQVPHPHLAATATITRTHPSAPPSLPRKKRLKGGGKRRGGDRRGSCCGWGSSSDNTTNKKNKSSTFGWTLWLAVALWYSLGVVSIATSKVLLLPMISHNMSSATSTGVHLSPLALTLQQLLIGSTLLRCLLYGRGVVWTGSSSAGLQPWPPPLTSHFISHSSVVLNNNNTISNNRSIHSNGSIIHHHHTNGTTNHSTTAATSRPPRELLWASMCFALGFLATNFGFAGSAASFVETVKAAEPITSATVAGCYGIESITGPQKASLGTIVAGVLLATLGNSSSSSGVSDQSAAVQPLAATLLSAAIVMTSNLCFSFRGLYQKLFRRVASAHVLDDLNLQYRMQWTGVLLLAGPVVVFDFLPTLCWKTYPWSTTISDSGSSPIQFLILAIINGAAFTSYNLASTFILSRISVVHHAALNCLRRVFAIVMTSLLFGVPITAVGAMGIGLAMAGFMLYTHYKIQQQQQHRRESVKMFHQQQQQQQHRSQGGFGSSTVLPFNGKLHV